MKMNYTKFAIKVKIQIIKYNKIVMKYNKIK